MKKRRWLVHVIFAANTVIRPDFAIIGEPTLLQPIRALQRHFINAIRITGQSVTLVIEKGVNAIELMHESYHPSPVQLRDRLKTRYKIRRLLPIPP